MLIGVQKIVLKGDVLGKEEAGGTDHDVLFISLSPQQNTSSAACSRRVVCWFSIMVSEGDYRIMDSSKKIGEAVVCRKSL